MVFTVQDHTVPMTLKWRYSQNCAKIHPNELWSVWITMVVLVFWLVWSFMTNFEFEKFLSNGFFSEFVSKFQTCFSYLYRTTSVTSYTSKWSSWFALFTVWRNPGGTWWQWPFLAFENIILVPILTVRWQHYSLFELEQNQPGW